MPVTLIHFFALFKNAIIIVTICWRLAPEQAPPSEHSRCSLTHSNARSSQCLLSHLCNLSWSLPSILDHGHWRLWEQRSATRCLSRALLLQVGLLALLHFRSFSACLCPLSLSSASCIRSLDHAHNLPFSVVVGFTHLFTYTHCYVSTVPLFCESSLSRF